MIVSFLLDVACFSFNGFIFISVLVILVLQLKTFKFNFS